MHGIIETNKYVKNKEINKMMNKNYVFCKSCFICNSRPHGRTDIEQHTVYRNAQLKLKMCIFRCLKTLTLITFWQMLMEKESLVL